MTRYPAFNDLTTAPDFLMFGAAAMRALEDAGWLERRVAHVPLALLEPRPRAPYQSNYIGVSRKYSGWRGHWAVDGKYVSGPTRPAEIEAAHDRAAALGLDYLEVRSLEETTNA